MNTITIDVTNLEGGQEWYELGYAGEAPDTTVQFSAYSWRAAYPTGVFSLVIRRPDIVDYPRVIRRTDGGCYPCAITETNGVVTYVVTASDTAVCGSGYLQLTISQGGTVMESAIVKTYVEWSATASGAAPPESMPWVQQVLDAKADAETAAAAAEAAAAEAEAAAADAIEAGGGSAPVLDDEAEVPTIAVEVGYAHSNRGFEQYDEPIVTFFDDDGHVRFLTEHVPVYRAKGVRATFAIVASRGAVPSGVTVSGDAYEALDYDQIRALVRDGFDMQSHTWSHDCHVFDGTYYTVHGVTEQMIDDEYRKADEMFRREGLEYDCIAFPFGAASPMHLNIAKRYAKFGVNAGGYLNGINEYVKNPMDINRFNLKDNTIETAKTVVETAISKKAWLVFMCHAGSLYPGVEKLGEIIDYIQARGVRIATFTEAAATRAPAYFSGDGDTAFRVLPGGNTQISLMDTSIKKLIDRAYAMGYMRTKTVSSISAVWGDPALPFVGEAIDPACVTVTATMSDGSTSVVTDDVAVVRPTVFAEGVNTVLMQYGMYPRSFTVTPSAAYAHMGTLYTRNLKTNIGDDAWFPKHLDAGTYTVRVILSKPLTDGTNANTAFVLKTASGTADKDGMELASFTYADARKKTHISATVTLDAGCDLFYVHMKSMDTTVSAAVYVNGTLTDSAVAAVVKSITVRQINPALAIGDAVTASDLLVTALKSDGTAEAVTGFTISSPAALVSGKNNYTITYSGVTAVLMVAGTPAKTTTFVLQPMDKTIAVGAETGSLYALAENSDGTPLLYQWYTSTTDSNSGGTAIPCAITPRLKLDEGLTLGAYYYYCVATGVQTVASDCCTVTVGDAQPEEPEPATLTITGQPADASVMAGSVSGNLTVTATVSDSSTLTYRWYANTTGSNVGGTLVSGATGASMAIPTTILAGTYYFYCLVTSATAGSVKSDPCTVTVAAAPMVTITGQPTDVTTTTAGYIQGNLTVTAIASDFSMLTYQWYASATDSNAVGTIISGETSASMNIPAGLTHGTYYYYCVVTSATAGSAKSSACTVSVSATPVVSFTTQPADIIGYVGNISGTLTVAASAGDASALTYQWYANTADSNAGGTPISGATSASMGVPSNLAMGTYYYYCMATSANLGTATSNPATVTVTAAPVVTITAQPADASVTAGSISGSLTVTALATDFSALTYQWYSNASDSSTGGTALPGMTGASMSIPSTLAEGTYFFYCTAMSATAGSATSAPCTVTVAAAPPATVTITVQPADVTVAEGSGGSLTVTASASDASALTYQWYSNTADSNSGGTPVSGATGASMTIPASLATGAYYYYCVATSVTAGSATSGPATVTVAEVAYIAQYDLTGTRATPVPATIADLSGNGNTLTVNGGMTYSGSGLPYTSAAASFTLSAVNLNGRTRYKIHIELGRQERSGANRIFEIPSIGLNAQIGRGTGTCFIQVESTGSLGFTSPIRMTAYSFATILDIYGIVFDWLVDGDSVTLNATLYDADNVAHEAQTAFTCTGFTAALAANGLYLCNRAAGDRGLVTVLNNFCIMDA